MRFLVTGAAGMLGSEVVGALESLGHEVWATDVADNEDPLDITREDRVDVAIRSFRPHWVVNCAAYTNVDGAEDDEETAFLLNARGPETLARSCRRHGARLLHMSTDYVFDGTKDAPYREDDLPNPLNVYGASKLAGEEAVRHVHGGSLIVRTQWLIGANGPNFVSKIIDAARERDRLEVVNDQYGSPTFAADLARALCLLMEKGAQGIYHVCNRGVTTWYELASRALAYAAIATPVVPVPTSAIARKARRPAYSALSTVKFSQETGRLMPLWQCSLEAFLHEYLGRTCRKAPTGGSQC